MSRRPIIRHRSVDDVASDVRQQVAGGEDEFVSLAEIVDYVVHRAYAEGMLAAYAELVPGLQREVHGANFGLSSIRQAVEKDRAESFSGRSS